MRLFVALPLPDPLRAELAALVAPVRGERAYRWLAPEALHLTLKFLGEVPEEALPAVTEGLGEGVAPWGPFDLRLGEVGTFPARGRPRVVWVGVEGDLAPLVGLAADLEGALTTRGFAPATRPFSPHITLGRARRRPAPLPEALRGRAVAGGFTAGEVILYRSELRPEGARHHPLVIAPLRAHPFS